MSRTDAQSCLPDGITFTTQSQIDSFPINYPGCTEIEGSVEISGVDISDLSGLSNLNSIGGMLLISSCQSLHNLVGLEGLSSIDSVLVIGQNYFLSSLSGLDNLSSVGTGLIILGNSSLTNLLGLDELTSVGGSVWIEGNYALSSLTGLESLTTIEGNLMILISYALNNLQGLDGLTNIGGELYLSFIDDLSSLTGLENLVSIGGGIRIWSNNSLVEITALYGLTEVGGQLSIRSNDALSSLYGLDNISPASITDLDISLNNSLSTCHIRSICNYLIAPNGEVSISGNATGCNSIEEVQDSCVANGVSIEELNHKNSLIIYPNPFTISTTIKYEVYTRSNIQYAVYNSVGEAVVEGEDRNVAPGKHTITPSLHHLPAGLYYAVLRSGDGMSVVKMIKQ